MSSNVIKCNQNVMKCTKMYSADFSWLPMTPCDSAWPRMTLRDFMWLLVTPCDSSLLLVTPHDSARLCVTLYISARLCINPRDSAWIGLTSQRMIKLSYRKIMSSLRQCTPSPQRKLTTAFKYEIMMLSKMDWNTEYVVFDSTYELRVTRHSLWLSCQISLQSTMAITMLH
jgi:hypothetical protein